MGASTQNDAGFREYMLAAPVGAFPIIIDVTIPATGLETANDRVNLASVEAGRTIACIDIFTNGAGDAHATPTLDMDIVLSENGASTADGTETILYNAGTRFQSASTTVVRTFVNHAVVDTTDGKGVVRTKVNTGAATAQAMTLQAIVWIC